MRYSTNLFPLKIEEQPFSVFKPDVELTREVINKLLYRLSKTTGSPSFYREGYVYVAGKSGKKEISLRLGEYFVKLTFYREEKTKPETREEVSQFLAEPLRNFSSEKEVRTVEKLGNIALIREVNTSVLVSKKAPLLRIDFSYSVVERKTVKELLKGGLKKEELYSYRLKPAGTDSTFEITDILYDLDEKDRHLIKEIATNPIVKTYMEKYITEDEPFLVLAGKYRYPAGVVRRSFRLEDIEEHRRREVFRTVKVSPQERMGTIYRFRDLLQSKLTAYKVYLGTAVETNKIIDFPHEVVDGDGKTYKDKDSTMKAIAEGKPFIRDRELKIAVIDTSQNPERVEVVLKDIFSFLEKKGFVCKWNYFRLNGISRREIKRKFYDLGLSVSDYNLGIVFLKDFGSADLFEEGTLYDFFKATFLNEFVPTQVIKEDTVYRWNNYALYNVAEGIMGKTGNIPYKLANPLKGVDIFVGLDISRAKSGKGGRTVSASAVTKIFLSNGEFLRFSVDTDPVGGETFASRTLETLAGNIYKRFGPGKRVVIHRDGKFQGKERDTILSVFRDYDLDKPVLVEIVKSGNPRLFPNPEKGLSLILDSNTAVISTYKVRQEVGSHMPVRVNRIYGDMDIETIAEHVLTLTMLNYGATSLAKLPATTYYPDRISYLALRGVQPPRKEGDKMYWL